ncbi:MAG: YadA-like family protein [Thiothrix sp.]|uniref:YadA-like family protein n=1 Tax=Thiothrix sp. TaxID=1032 RepID=UPI00260CB27B|nr:YadA-like family protein [Thiothrix sp.]MDD5391577.1 YadA-like family protein [Thiothrix sp.]
MKSTTQKKIYFSVASGLGLLGSFSAYADTTTNDNDSIILNVNQDSGFIGSVIVNDSGAAGADPGQWVFDAENGFSSRPSSVAGTSTLTHTSTGGVNVTGTGAAADIKSVSGANHTTINHAKASGSHTVGPKSNTWFFDETGSSVNVADGANTTVSNQTGTAQYNEAAGGGSVASRNQTRFGQTDSVVVGASSNTMARLIGSTTNTVDDGGGNATRVTQDTLDVVTATDGGVGASGAEIAVRRSGGAGNTQATVLVRNAAGNTHGLTVGESSTTLSGGTNSTTLTLDDNGAKFNGVGGAPARVTGVADGAADFDAVNFRQLNNLDKNLTKKINETGAISAAFAQLGQAQTPGKSTFGIAAGGQGGKSGLAIGFSHRPVTMKPVVIKASLGASGSTTSGGVGATWEF